MTKTKEDKVSYSAIAGELRKAARMYEVFKHASEAADTLAKFEAEIKVYTNKAAKLKAELYELDKECDVSYNKKVATEVEIKQAKDEVILIKKKGRADASILVNKAKTQAEKIMEEVKEELAVVKASITKAKVAEKDSLEAKAKADSELHKVEDQIQSVKDKFLKV